MLTNKENSAVITLMGYVNVVTLFILLLTLHSIAGEITINYLIATFVGILIGDAMLYVADQALRSREK